MLKKQQKYHENTPDHYENAEFHLGFCNRVSDIFCTGCKNYYFQNKN